MIKLKSFGKLNLFLDILGKLPNGYHSIKTVMQSINLYDTITINIINEDKISIECNDKNIPTNETNTCYKACQIIKNKYNIKSGISITLYKNIPSGAGLAGGSSNSAAVIIGLNSVLNLGMSVETMNSIATTIGADVPFCLFGGTYLAEGIGEKLTKLNNFCWNNILLVKPTFSISTEYVYKNLSKSLYNSSSNNKILDYISNNDFVSTSKSTFNTLELSVKNLYPQIDIVKNIMLKNNALSSLMTGSGSAIYGLFPDNGSLNSAYIELANLDYIKYLFKTNTVNYGISIE